MVQVGAIAAVLVYFRRDTAALAAAWFRGLAGREARKRREYRMAWYVIAGSVPIGIVGFAAKGLISGPLRNLWVVVVALFLWSVVMVLAERLGSQGRAETDLRLQDTMVVGVIQCLALVPGVSRSAATMSAGLFCGLDRTVATRLSFFLSIPATGSGRSLWGGVTAASDISDSVGWGATAVATGVSFAVAYASIAWLLRLVASPHHRLRRLPPAAGGHTRRRPGNWHPRCDLTPPSPAPASAGAAQER